MDANQPNPAPHEPLQPPRTLLDAVPEFAMDEPAPPPPRSVWGPVILFLATCASTFAVGALYLGDFPARGRLAIVDGLMYSGAVMTILLCHEMGHFLQALRYGVYASLPYFIPMPLSPIGTFGAVIRMEPGQGDRKELFDIGISGPLAGLVPTFIFLCLGLQWSHWAPTPQAAQPQNQIVLGEPLLMQYLETWLKGPAPEHAGLVLHPVAFAGWVGLLITSINLIPLGQLDGGHIVYGMCRKTAHLISVAVLVIAVVASIYMKLTTWWLLLVLIVIMGIRHPPTADDSVPLGAGRYILGLLTLAFFFLGFTPEPMRFLGQ